MTVTENAEAGGAGAGEAYRLSPLQQRISTVAAGEPGPYLVRGVVAVDGPLDVSALGTAVDAVVARYEILRTGFPTLPSMSLPVQAIGPARPGRLDVDGAVPEPGPDADAVGGVRTPPRFRLTRLGPGRHRLEVTASAMCLDTGSIGPLTAAIAAEYHAAVGGPAPTAEPVQYADLAEWLNELLESPESAAGRDHWRGLSEEDGVREALASDLPLVEPAPDPRSDRFTPRGCPVPVEAETSAAIDDFEATSDAVLLAVWRVLLARLTAERRVLVAVAADGRDDEELADVVGPLTRFTPHLAAVDPQWSLRATVERLGAADAENGRLHQYFGWDLPAEAATPYVPLAFEYLDLPGAVQAGPVTFRVVDAEGPADRFDLKLSAVRTPDGLATVLRYDAEALDDATASRLAAHLGQLLREALSRPDTPIAELSLLPPAQQRALLAGTWRAAPPPTVEPICFHHRFQHRAASTPDRPAVVYGDTTLTFGELNARANRLARHLATRGVAAETLVGVCLPPGPELPVAVLAVLKAGGGYVPLDPDGPAERVAFQLRDAGLKLVVTVAEVATRLRLPSAEMLRLDTDLPPADPDEPTADPAPVAGPDNPAYAIYTSGSTGRPKGVLVSHRALAAFHDAMRAAVYGGHLDRPARVVLNAPVTFDASLQQLVLLLDGHELHLLPPSLRRDNHGLVRYLRGQGIAAVNATPTQLATLVDAGLLAPAGADGTPPALLIVAGEALPGPLAATLAAAPATAVYNCYGPTEATVNATYLRLTADVSGAAPPIGRPLPGYHVYVLDERGRPVPPGVPGELYLGGPGLARGYLGRPDLTAERFVPDPFGDGGRLYRTGDLGRYRADGRLDFLGRIDDQVKINGFRVEPAEVAEALRRHPDVRDAVATVRDGVAGPRLVGYYVAGTGAPSLDALREFLGERLPPYMVPAVLVPIDAIPTTRGGKVDRAALPAPDSSRPELTAAYQAPRFPTEDVLCAVWAAALGVDRVGIDDDFFALGGDSIRSIQMRAVAAERDVAFSVQQLFEHRTVRRLAAAIAAAPERADPTAPARPVGPFELLDDADRAALPDGVVAAYPLAATQAGMVFDSEYRPGAPVFHNTRTAHLRAPLHPDLLREVLDQIAREHPILRTSFALTGFREPLQLVQQTARVPLEVYDLRDLPADERERALADFVAAEQARRFDWAQAPLVRFAVHRRTDETFQFTLTMHEAVLDGWSVATLLTDLFGRYLAAVGGAPVAERPCRAAFVDFVAAERDSVAREADRDFWLDRLAGTTGTLLSPGRGGRGDRHRLVDVPVDPKVAEGLAGVARSLAVPLKSVLLAAHVRATTLATGEADVVTGLVANGRMEVADGERVLGQFLNTLPLRVRVGAGSWAELVRAVFALETAQLPHRRYPLTRITRDLGVAYLLDTAFNFTSFHVYRQMEQAGVEVIETDLRDQTGLSLLADFGVDPYSGAIRLELSCTGLDDAEVDRLVGYYRDCLAALAADPAGRQDRLRSPQARPSGEPADRAGGESFALRFGRQAARTPQARAVSCGDQVLSYAELDERTAALAALLRGRGVGRESVVGVLAPRGVQLLVGVVAVLRAGAAYLPLHPGDPAPRLRAVLDGSAPALVLTGPDCAAVLAEVTDGVATLPIDSGAAAPIAGAPPAAVPDPSLGHPGDLACVLHTSGSTGLPKGVLLEAGGVLNHLLAKIDEFGLAGGDRVAQTARSTFVVAVWQLLAPLLVGAEVVVLPDEVVEDPTALVPVLARERITVAEVVASYLDAALRPSAEPVPLPDLRFMISTGEALPAHVARRWFERYPAVPLVNAYGQTECSDDVASWHLGAAPEGDNCPIGSAYPHAGLHILDDALEPVPTGTVGHLYVGGFGVGRGYLGDPAGTAAAFRPDPSGSGRRLYATGDLARERLDGLVEHRGRSDRQVQVHGVRIEPGEIEAVLAAHPAVERVVVATGAAVDGTPRLVAFVETGEADAAELTGHVRRHLPAAFVPAVVAVTSLPSNANGKVDHAALPWPSAARPSSAVAAPRTPTERAVADICATVLRRESVGVHDDFFELGADSLTVTVLAFELRSVFGVDVPVHEVYDQPTVAGIAEFMERGGLETGADG
ncbi:non-ribosomal peptide synthetase [Plantactinospora sp. BB1]|uniref:non-ribosomal peptide synthetase n=1 Tax=Plantactinospora sp. BB1 TaxID=2071627 RepID=UPI000D162400|nr:non-ribosomal peptide synthetase [Plantactinospora sp. BB1]AVT35238.1 hypothetical protein C6W10_00770 [Plantactinospora sp. BB1]